jgi:hypothetical protein
MKSLIKSAIFTTLASFLVLGQLSNAQEVEDKDNTDVPNKIKRFWQASLPGGHYMVALDRISAISKHSYMVKSLVVHEVNIQVNGSGLVRFYAFEMTGENTEANLAKNLIERGKNLVEQGGRRAGVDTNTTVEKEYAVTTHSQTIEYRLFDNGDLNQLYGSLRKAWIDGRGRTFTVN